MEEYGRDGRCLMESLRIELDDPGAEPCGRCSICTEPKFGGELDRGLALQAIDMLRARPIEIEPRRVNADGGRRLQEDPARRAARAGPRALPAERRRLGPAGPQGQVGGRALRRRAGRGRRGPLQELEPGAGADMGDGGPVAAPSRAGPGLRRAPGEGDRPALLAGAHGREEDEGAEQARELAAAVPERAGGVRGGPRRLSRRARCSWSTTSSTRSGRFPRPGPHYAEQGWRRACRSAWHRARWLDRTQTTTCEAV